jgi:predicted ester cyclase
MSTERNKAIVHRYYEEMLNQRRFGIADEIFGKDFKPFPDWPPPHGPESIKQMLIFLTTVFPDLQVTVEDEVVEGDKVATLVTMYGSHTNAIDYIQGFGTIPPTGKPFEVPEFVLWQVIDGKIIERKSVLDFLPMLRKIGATPVKVEA